MNKSLDKKKNLFTIVVWRLIWDVEEQSIVKSPLICHQQ